MAHNASFLIGLSRGKDEVRPTYMLGYLNIEWITFNFLDQQPAKDVTKKKKALAKLVTFTISQLNV